MLLEPCYQQGLISATRLAYDIIAFDLCHVLSATRMEHENVDLVKAVGSMYDLTPSPLPKITTFQG